MQNLHTYLNDHKGASAGALELMESLVEQTSDEEVRDCVCRIHTQVAEEASILEGIIELLDAGKPLTKQAAGWVSGVASQLKLGPGVRGKFGEFQAVESLSLAVLGKRALWVLRDKLQPGDLTPPVAYAKLAEASAEQHRQLEALRQRLGEESLRGDRG
ncbi:hypothetical protein [Botrimarina sp.]|uniref:hypothetical protein n=1 Tax=Botrimarina sp. TaxID=2795802 RepID=UPI0032EF00AB